ncbi:MAG: hydroxyacid dehydrogenase [Burkholderiaceae bacterium]
MKKIVVTEPIHPDGLALLRARRDFDIEVLDRCDADSLRAALADAHGVLVRSARLTAEIIAAAPRLEVVSRHGVGCDQIDVACCSQRGIPVAIAAEANAWSVAEHTLMMMLSLAKCAFDYDTAVREGRFGLRGSLPAFELAGRTALVVGYGRIGRLVAPLLKAFRMRVIVADIALDAELAREQGCEGVEDFRGWLDQAEVLTVHVPLDETTRHLIGASELARLPKGAIVINNARGGVVDELALAEVLESGHLSGAGVDVYEQEPPPPEHPLLRAPNALLTPHNAASTREGTRRMAVGAAQNIIDFHEGRLARSSIFNAAALS